MPESNGADGGPLAALEAEERDTEVGPEDAATGPVRPKHKPDQTLRISGADLERYRNQREVPRRGSLLVIAGDPADVGTHILVDERVVIGREGRDSSTDDGAAKAGALLQLRDGRSSRQHAAVEQSGQTYLVTDLGSTNGTLLEGAQVTGSQPLRDGDKITIGQSLLKFTLVDDT